MTYEELQAAYPKHTPHNRAVAVAHLQECVETLFAANPEVQQASVMAYTPGFNDGDPCAHTQEGATVDLGVACEDGSFLRRDEDGGIEETTLDDAYGWEPGTGYNTPEARSDEHKRQAVEVRDMIERMAPAFEAAYDTNFGVLMERTETGVSIYKTDYYCGH